METFVYFGGVSNLMNQTHKASARRCKKIWQQINVERVLKQYAEMEYNYNERNLSDCLIATEEDEDYAEEFIEALNRKYNWLRQQEIM